MLRFAEEAGVVGRDRVEKRGDLGTARVGRDMREVVAEADEAAGTQSLVKARQYERPLFARRASDIRSRSL